jgi:internalin A
MRIIIAICGLMLAFPCLNFVLNAGESKPAEPTAEQLAIAKDALAKRGAKYKAVPDPQGERTAHIFEMPKAMTDTDVKGLPDLPFLFGLSLQNTQVTDAGLKELKDLKNLSVLGLSYTQVTDAGLKELKDHKSLIFLNLAGTKVTDAGMKDLKALENLTGLSLHATK